MEGYGKFDLVALDMDGTLLNSEHMTTPYTRAVLERAAQAGKVVALSTGRALSELWAHLIANPSIAYVIGESGACVYDVRDRRALRRLVMDDDDVEFILSLAERYDDVWQAFLNDQSYIQGALDESLVRYHVYEYVDAFRAGSRVAWDLHEMCRNCPGSVGKINIYFAQERDRQDFLRHIAGRRLALTDSIGLGVEISPMEASKASGLRALCDHLDIPVERTVAVGDGGNDLEIMKTAGLAVAMGNAIEQVRVLAGAVTDDCDHDGAAKAIERYVLVN